MNPLSRVMTGALSPVRGLAIVFDSRKTFLLSIFPFIIGVLGIGLSLGFAFYYVLPMLDGVVDSLDFSNTSWGQTLGDGPISWIKAILFGIVMVGAYAGLGLIAFIIGYVFIMIFSGPFFALLAEEIFKQKTVGRLSGESIKIMLSLFGSAMIKLLLFTVFGLFWWVISFIPGMGLIAPIPLFMMVAFDCMDYAFEVDKLRLRQRFSFFFSHIWEFIGLTAAVYLTSLFSAAFFILLPAFICGATDLYIKRTENEV